MRQLESPASTLPPTSLTELQAEQSAIQAEYTDELIQGTPYSLAHGLVRVPHALLPVKYTVSVPEKTQDARPHVVVPGFSGFKKSSRMERDALAEDHGRVAISYEPARYGGPINDLRDPQKLHSDTISAIAQDLCTNKQLQAVQNGDKLDFSKLILLPHSMGGLAATRVAAERSNDVDAIIYKASVGMEQAKLFRFFGRLLESIPEEIGPAIQHGEFGEAFTPKEICQKAATYLLSNPLRTSGEILSCFRANLRPMLPVLRAYNVKTGMILFDNDRLIPAQLSFEHCGSEVDMCKRLPDFDHLAPQTKGKIVAREEIDMLTALEA